MGIPLVLQVELAIVTVPNSSAIAKIFEESAPK